MKLNDIQKKRKRKIVADALKKFKLDLTELTVFTEAATGNYLYTPIIAALSGAEQVFALARDSKYCRKEDVRYKLMREAKELSVQNKILVLFEKDKNCIAKSDIITNSGFVRPITKREIACMKSTAVIPLMWEAWEFRPDELDLETCRRRGILVLGTNEHHPLLKLFDSNGFLACKLLFDKGFDVYKDKILLVASGHIGNSISDFFINNSISFSRLSFDNNIPRGQKRYLCSLKNAVEKLREYDAMVIAEHHHDVNIISKNGLISVDKFKKANPAIQIIHICGLISKIDIAKSGLSLYPEDVMPFGHMTVSPDYLGPKTLLELNTAGLKIGEIMARNRLKYDFKRAYRESIKNPLVSDFKEGYLTYGK